MLSLPLAFLALVPSGSVGPALYRAVAVISAIFPLEPALEAIGAATSQATRTLATSIAHLAAPIVGLGGAARVGLPRTR